MFLQYWPPQPYDSLRHAISQAHRKDETQVVTQLLAQLRIDSNDEQQISTAASKLIVLVRERVLERPAIQIFMQQYGLATEEGIMLMCLAEALLRIPDAATEDLLIQEKLTGAAWSDYVGRSESALVNWASWGLALTGKILQQPLNQHYLNKIWHDLIARCGEPIVRQAVREAIKIMSQQFVLGQNMPAALKASAVLRQHGYLYSYDMLGEVARTDADAKRYFIAYKQAIAVLSAHDAASDSCTDLMQRPSISVKLSALYPRYEPTQAELAVPFLTARVKQLARDAMQAGISLILDAEESDRLEMSLDIFAATFTQAEFAHWPGLGLALQAYQKRALPVISWLSALAREHQKRIPVRLVKGAYWDTEIKLSQLGGFDGYPVFTRKAATDVNYLVCAQELLAAIDAIYPQFATHNAYTVAAILHMAAVTPAAQNREEASDAQFEFQSLQGMGQELHDILLQQHGYRCRIYAPVGSYQDLLPYLVRRLLENGANSSFVNQIADKTIPIASLVENPCALLRRLDNISHPRIPLPRAIFGTRVNSMGIDLSNYDQVTTLAQQLQSFSAHCWQAAPALNKRSLDTAQKIMSPSDINQQVGWVWEAQAAEIEQALVQAQGAVITWQACPIPQRARYLLQTADLIEQHYPELISLMMREAGKTVVSAIAEVREAVDYCRYYAKMAQQQLLPKELLSPTGERDILQLHGRGVMLCISPWNFPLAIFTGQIVSALVAGNTVLAKPAEQTPLIAARMVELLHQAGIPPTVLQLLPGRGEIVAAALTADPRVSGVIFTGSTETAKIIAQTLVSRPGPLVPLIAETGGINAMIVDSSALPEQWVADALTSAFDSAGQRCSSLRVLCLQQDIADHFINLLRGAMAELRVGSPLLLSTDIGPVIDRAAQDMLMAHQELLRQQAKLIYEVVLPAECLQGYFVAPQAYEIDDLSLITKEVFGPILHVYRYPREQLPQVIAAINSFGYGLTFGVHSRINSTIEFISQHIQAGNVYVNRNMVGAVVGVQPFGGSRLSGTGPKAGGPHYLTHLCTEKTISVNTTAMGGNTTLMTLK